MTEPRLCIVCPQLWPKAKPAQLTPTELQTCVRCLGTTRRNLLDIADMYPLLPDELQGRAGAATPPEPNGHIHGDTNPMPGGDVMVLLGPGSDGANQAREIIRSKHPETAAPHAADEHPEDPPSIIGELERWETNWRKVFRHPTPAEPATVASCIEYLTKNLAHAAQQHDEFPAFADDLNQLKHAMETALRRGPQRSPVPCITCGARALERPEPRDDGRRFEWQCGRCHTNYTEAEYWIAVRQQGEAV